MAKILIVEDERSIRQALRFELEDQGYEVGDAADYSEAVSAMRAFDYDLVISDIYLNNGDGVQLIRTTYEDNKNVPFIGMSAFPGSDLVQKAKIILKDRFFEKPFLASAIKEKINEVLSVHPSLISNFKINLVNSSINSLREFTSWRKSTMQGLII